jgi:hypothetical protein
VTKATIDLMNLLANIDTRRHIDHEAGQVVHLHWDTHHFRLTRANFTNLVHALERGAQRLYACEGRYNIVQVDDDVREIWIGKTCLSLNSADYRALLNAALTTETRLHGFRPPAPPLEKIAIQPVATMRAPRPARPCWN